MSPPFRCFMNSSVVTQPTPAYQNPPIEPQFFQPSRFVIIALSLGETTTVTTGVDNNYVIGQLVRLIIPIGYGSRELTGQTGYVIQIPASNQVVLNINSKNVNAFINASLLQVPQIIAIGDVNSGIISSTGSRNVMITVPGAFVNISPL